MDGGRWQKSDHSQRALAEKRPWTAGVGRKATMNSGRWQKSDHGRRAVAEKRAWAMHGAGGSHTKKLVFFEFWSMRNSKIQLLLSHIFFYIKGAIILKSYALVLLYRKK
jgi:hypothetical protein